MNNDNRGIPDERGYIELNTEQQSVTPPPVDTPPTIAVPPTIPGAIKPTSGKATASLVLGIVSCASFCFCYGFVSLICGTLAIVFASQARKDMASGLYTTSNLGQAKAGHICGIVGLCLGGLMLVLGIVWAVLAVVSSQV